MRCGECCVGAWGKGLSGGEGRTCCDVDLDLSAEGGGGEEEGEERWVMEEMHDWEWCCCGGEVKMQLFAD